MEKTDFLYQFWKRQSPLFTGEERSRITQTRFLVLGIGANGGPCAETLARMGAVYITVADHDLVEISNLNRQPYEHDDRGMPKVQALVRRIRRFAPHTELHWAETGYQLENSDQLLKNTDIVIDAMDDYRMKVHLSRAASERDLPVVHTAGAGYRATTTTFLPGSTTYETLFHLPSVGRVLSEVTDEEFGQHRRKVAAIIGDGMYPADYVETMKDSRIPWPTIAPSCWISGIVAAMESVKLAMGYLEKMVIAPELLQIDVMHMSFRRFTLHDDGDSTYKSLPKLA